FTAGEDTDAYTQALTVDAPRITTASASDGHVLVTFNEAINGDTFTPDLVHVTGPGGPLTVTGVTEVPSSQGLQFDIAVDGLPPATVQYTLAIDPGIQDVYGNSTAAYSSHIGTAVNLVTNGGFESGNFSGWTQSGDTGATAVSTSSFFPGSVHSGTFAAHFGP